MNCCFEDCKESAITRVGKLSAPVCFIHVLIWQKIEAKRREERNYYVKEIEDES